MRQGAIPPRRRPGRPERPGPVRRCRGGHQRLRRHRGGHQDGTAHLPVRRRTGVQPRHQPGLEEGEETATWFKGYRYYGGFQYRRSGGDLTVINIVDVEDYVKGVLPYEMNNAWPLEALKAQAVCARTYAAAISSSHASAGFDVCNNTHCQMYQA